MGTFIKNILFVVFILLSSKSEAITYVVTNYDSITGNNVSKNYSNLDSITESYVYQETVVSIVVLDNNTEELLYIDLWDTERPITIQHGSILLYESYTVVDVLAFIKVFDTEELTQVNVAGISIMLNPVDFTDEHDYYEYTLIEDRHVVTWEYEIYLRER